jgi:hypothetical protein
MAPRREHAIRGCIRSRPMFSARKPGAWVNTRVFPVETRASPAKEPQCLRVTVIPYAAYLIFNRGKQADCRRAPDARVIRVRRLSAYYASISGARSTTMHFALLLSNLPHVEESRSHYYTYLSLQPRETSRVRALWQRLKTFAS